MGSESFQRQNSFSRGSGVFLEFLEWLEAIGANDWGYCEIWEFFEDFVEFWECLKGLGPSHNYFLKPRGLSGKSPGVQGPQVNLHQGQEVLCKITRIYQILVFFL
jgi:hypothetical protein